MNMFRSLSSRLTILYTLLFAILSLVVFSLIDNNLEYSLLERIDAEFYEDGQDLVEIYQDEGLEALISEVEDDVEEESAELIFFRIYSPDHMVIKATDLSHWKNLPDKSIKLSSTQDTQFETISLPNHPNRARLFYKNLGDGHIVQAGIFLTSDEQLLTNFRQLFVTAFAIMLLCGVFVGYLMARRALIGIQQVRQAADHMSHGDLSQRILTNHSIQEIDNLARSFNNMQDRIKTLISELQDITNNVAHDLRSPVTRMRGLAETTLTGNQTLEEYKEVAATVIEECDRLVGMINTMLEIAVTDAGIQKIDKAKLNLSEIVQDVATLFTPVAEDKNIAISTDIHNAKLCVYGDRSRLQRALANLLDNALKYTTKGGRVFLTTGNSNDNASVTITDTGPGISDHDLPHIFDRFYRGDQSRSTPGNGLGLSLVQAIVKDHGGKIAIKNSQGNGTQVTVLFPINR